MRILKFTVVFFICCELSIDFSLSAKCGQKKSKEWPWMARILRAPSSKFFCSGTLISPKSVLSAASCFQPKGSQKVLQPSEVTIQLGKHYLSRLEKDLMFQPDSILIHSEWNSTENVYDLALLTFPEGVEITDLISHACFRTNFTSNAQGTIVGWDFSRNKNHDTPREVGVIRQSDDVCNKNLETVATLSSNKTSFCASQDDLGFVSSGKLKNLWKVNRRLTNKSLKA